ncbi:hypothetical protein TEA_000416 [Camellia sinensis var. sinensis]|uniref:Uncharacterized protein n=1 Tax=Camellia sinensis var. sinensis TaxID=542762 RepID=A0A4S4E744_CAMSN|nr:hypothetical protein TEA_000416 [Camellia sinensis var. sinensis]
MENQRNTLLTWAYYCQGKVQLSLLLLLLLLLLVFESSALHWTLMGMDELRQSLLLATLELETTRLKAQEELKMRDDQLNHLKDLVTEAIRERDEAQDKCQRLVFERLLFQQQQLHLQQQQQQQQLHLQQQQQCQQNAPLSGISSIEDEPRRGLDSNNGFSSSDCEESIVSSPVIDPIPPPTQLPPPIDELINPLVSDKPLPEKGKLLQAVMKAGPLLQTLLLAGPLPQWRHPPPPIDSYQIPPPPVAIPARPPQQLIHQDSFLNIDNCSRIDRKRGLCEGSVSPTETKYERVVLH